MPTPKTRTAIIEYTNVAPLAERYDAFLVDLWGVIHDGIEAYDGVAECLQNLQNVGKKIIFLSNAPRRAIRAIEKMRELQIGDELYNELLTSGEVTFDYMQSSQHGFGKHYMMIGPARDNGLLDGLDFSMVSDAADASFVIVTGFDHDDCTIDDVLPQLNTAYAHNLPMICANPDMIIVRKSGKRALCAGAIARHYAQMGGTVQQFGKPYASVYERAISYIPGIPKNRIAAIGDNLETDILGANTAGFDSYLIPGGILGEDLGISHGQLPDLQKLTKLCQQYHAIPTGVLPEFVW